MAVLERGIQHHRARQHRGGQPYGAICTPSLGVQGTDGVSQSPRAVVGTGTCPMESVRWRFGSRAVKEGDKSRACCY